MSPPALAATEPRVGQISAERVADLSTRTQQMRFLVAELGVTRLQAHRLIRAHEADLRAAVIVADRERSFLAWLMVQAPGGRRRATQKREWRYSS